MSFDRLTGVIFSFWSGFIFTIAYAFSAFALVFVSDGPVEAQAFLAFFFGEYGGFWTGSLCFMVFILTVVVLKDVPRLIEAELPAEELEKTEYYQGKKSFEDIGWALGQSTLYFMMGFLIYSICQFKAGYTSHVFLTIFTALQYSFGGLLGRKLWWIAHMLRSVETAMPPANLMESQNLQKLILTVNIFTFLTFVTTLVHTYFHFKLEYNFQGLPAIAAQYMPLIPAILATPVLVLFNFFPRATINKLYLRSIERLRSDLERQIDQSEEDTVSTKKLLIDYKKYLHEEYRYKQRAALSELPIVLAIITLILTISVRLVTGG